MRQRAQRVLRSAAIAGTSALLSAAAATPPAVASEPDSSSEPAAGPAVQPEPDTATALARAKELHRRGIAMLQTGDHERALEYFRQSRAVYPSAKNIANEAICLQRLGRFDEALDVYETLLTEYADGLSAEDRSKLSPIMANLRQRIGRLWITGTVEGAVVLVDGRKRASLPARAPIRVLPGERRVRVLKPGYDIFEVAVQVAVGERLDVDAKLEPLAQVGVLRVEDEAAEAAMVFVDGVEMGPTPWEGLLGPGAHMVWTRRGERGSGLQPVSIVEGQITLVRARAEPLGPTLRIQAEPNSAQIEVDGIVVGNGSWQGRLPVGEHSVRLSEPGYHSQARQWQSRADAEAAALAISLPIDEDHPRWPSSFDGNFWLEAFGGYAGTNTIGAGAEDDCPSGCTSGPAAHGFTAGARAGYRFPFGLSLELGGGYLWFQGMLERRIESRYGPNDEYAVRYDLDDQIIVRGPYVAPGLSYRMPLSETWHLSSRLSFGIYFSAANDDVTGTARAGEQRASVYVPSADPARQVTLFVMPALGAGTRLGPIDLGLALGVAFFPLEGPSFGDRYTIPTPEPDPANPSALGNAQATSAIAHERAWSTFMLWVPELTLGYTFE